MSQFKRSAGNLLLCIAELLVGILLFINPVGFTSGIIVTLGIVLALNGLRYCVHYFKEDPEVAAEEGSFVKGLVYLMAGLFCTFKSEWFFATFPILSVFYGVSTLLSGVRKLQWAIDMLRQKQKFWFIALIGAVLTLGFAVLILLNPFATTAILWTFIAVSLIVEAAMDILTYIFDKK